MNTTPITSRTENFYTVVGGPGPGDAGGQNFSIILLNRGSSLSRAEALGDFEKLKAGEIICVENPGNAWAIESLTARFPRVRFILLPKEVSPGECINIGMEEASHSLAAVFWSDMKVVSAGLPEAALAALRDNPVLCAMPWFYSKENESMPVLQIPALEGKRLKVFPVLPAQEISPTLFPCDYCGVYSREKFLAIGGYDAAITESYWQKVDFGFRALLWGEKITAMRLLRTGTSESAPVENTGSGGGSRMFFLKNLAVRLGPEGGFLPWSAFLPFFLHSGCGLFTALAEFRGARRWVALNSKKFIRDSAAVMENWGDSPE